MTLIILKLGVLHFRQLGVGDEKKEGIVRRVLSPLAYKSESVRK